MNSSNYWDDADDGWFIFWIVIVVSFIAALAFASLVKTARRIREARAFQRRRQERHLAARAARSAYSSAHSRNHSVPVAMGTAVGVGSSTGEPIQANSTVVTGVPVSVASVSAYFPGTPTANVIVAEPVVATPIGSGAATTGASLQTV